MSSLSYEESSVLCDLRETERELREQLEDLSQKNEDLELMDEQRLALLELLSEPKTI